MEKGRGLGFGDAPGAGDPGGKAGREAPGPTLKVGPFFSDRILTGSRGGKVGTPANLQWGRLRPNRMEIDVDQCCAAKVCRFGAWMACALPKRWTTVPRYGSGQDRRNCCRLHTPARWPRCGRTRILGRRDDREGRHQTPLRGLTLPLEGSLRGLHVLSRERRIRSVGRTSRIRETEFGNIGRAAQRQKRLGRFPLSRDRRHGRRCHRDH